MYLTFLCLKPIVMLQGNISLDHPSQEAKVLRLTPEELSCPQLLTPIHINNSMATSIVNNTIKCQHSMAVGMCYFWLLGGYVQKSFVFCTSQAKRTLLIIFPKPM